MLSICPLQCCVAAQPDAPRLQCFYGLPADMRGCRSSRSRGTKPRPLRRKQPTEARRRAWGRGCKRAGGVVEAVSRWEAYFLFGCRAINLCALLAQFPLSLVFLETEVKARAIFE